MLLLVIGLVGCGKPPVTTVPPPPHDWIAEMKNLAREHHMRYRIFCVRGATDPNDQFQAQVQSGHFGEHLDDQTWQAGDGATQVDAAENLMGAVRRLGFNPPKLPVIDPHKPTWLHKECPPEISGEEFVEKP